MRSIAYLPLHHGKCPSWLFIRMKRLSRAIGEIIIEEYGEELFVKKLSDPFFFQAFGNVVGFDWHSSGLTTTLIGALKEGFKDYEGDFLIVGGKGKAMQGIKDAKIDFVDKEKVLTYAKLSAKIDNNVLQDGFELYEHAIIISKKAFAVINQGMNNKWARRYHWLNYNGIIDPWEGIMSNKKKEDTLNLASRKNHEIRKASIDLVNDGIREEQASITEFLGIKKKKLVMVKSHWFNKREYKVLEHMFEQGIDNYEELIMFKGVGKKVLRGLALTAKLMFDIDMEIKDPKVYSFAFGGKDGIPFPVEKKAMDKATRILKQALEEAKIGKKEKLEGLKKLIKFYPLNDS